MAKVSPPDAVDASPNLNLLLAWPERRSLQSWAVIGAIAGSIQAIFFVLLLGMANLSFDETPERTVVFHETKVYLPHDLLTQRAPNRQKPAVDVNLQDLLPSRASRVERPSPQPSTRHVEVPKFAAPVVQKPEPKAQPQLQPPDLNAKNQPTRLPQGLNSDVPIHAPPPEDKAKSNQPFQDIGSDEAPYNPNPTIHVPKPTVDGAIQSLAQTPNARHLIVTDQNMSRQAAPGLPGSISQAAAQHVEVELKNDSEAPDFRAYLARILAVVRSNWRLVTPESVRLGTLRGENTIELVIDRSGNIPKLVIGRSANNQALDQASVAGVSMSNPLPPLPADFKGEQVRLAFTFKYNVQE